METSEGVKHSLDAIRSLDLLEGCEGFGWFMGRVRVLADGLAAEVLDGDLTPDAREALRQQRAGMVAILKLAGEERLAHGRNLAAAGFTPGSLPR